VLVFETGLSAVAQFCFEELLAVLGAVRKANPGARDVTCQMLQVQKMVFV